MGINWNPVMSTTGTVFSTGADIYSAYNNGKINAIIAKTKAEQIQHNYKMQKINATVENSILETNLAEQIDNMTQKYNDISSSQTLESVAQGRTLDSLASIQNNDQRQYNQDINTTKTNVTNQKNMINTNINNAKLQADVDVANENRAATNAMNQGIVDGFNAFNKGFETLNKNDAFSTSTYKSK